MNVSNLSKESSVYQYTLIKKINYPLPVRIIYYSSISAYLLIVILTNPIENALSIVLSAIALQLMYGLLIVVICATQHSWKPKQWSFSYQMLWFGWTPKQLISLKFLKSLHWQLCLIGFSAILCLFPWFSIPSLIHLLVIHAWFLLPQLIILSIFSKFKKHGLVKINAKDCGLYTQ